MTEIHFHPEADAEYRHALRWYRTRSESTADRYEANLEAALAQILSYPQMFPTLDYLHRYVKIERFPYVVVYRIDPDRIVVIAVAHARRRPRYWLDRS